MIKKLNNKLQIISNTNYFFLLIICLVACFIISEPKVSSSLFLLKRQTLLQEFLLTTNQKHFIDPQEYWQFREFYSPGHFVVNKYGLHASTISNLENVTHIPLIDITPMLFYNSNFVISIDGLTTNSLLVEQLKLPKNSKILFQTKNQKIYQIQNEMFIIMELPISEMKKANGFFDYTGDDKELLQGKYWVNITQIKTN